MQSSGAAREPKHVNYSIFQHKSAEKIRKKTCSRAKIEVSSKNPENFVTKGMKKYTELIRMKENLWPKRRRKNLGKPRSAVGLEPAIRLTRAN